MKKIKKIMLPLLSATALSSCIVPLVACQPKVATYSVAVKEHGISVNAPATATQNQAYTFERILSAGDSVDYEKSYIRVGETKLGANDYTVDGNKVTILAEKVTGNIEIAAWSTTPETHFTVKHTIEEAAYHVTNVLVAPVAIKDQDLSIIVTTEPHFVPVVKATIKGSTSELTKKEKTGTNQWTFTLPGDSIVDNVTLSVSETKAENINVEWIGTASEFAHGYSISEVTADQPAYFTVKLDDGKKLDVANSKITLSKTATSLVAGFDFVLNKSNEIMICKSGVNLIIAELQQSEGSVKIQVAVTDGITIKYTKTQMATDHFVENEKIHSEYIPGQPMTFDFSNFGKTDTGWYGLEFGYRVTARPTITIYNWEVASGKLTSTPHELQTSDFTWSPDLNKAVIESRVTTAFTNVDYIDVKFDVTEKEAYITKITSNDATIKDAQREKPYGVDTFEGKKQVESDNHSFYVNLNADTIAAGLTGQHLYLSVKMVDKARDAEYNFEEIINTTDSHFAWTNSQGTSAKCLITFSGTESPYVKSTGGAIWEVECTVKARGQVTKALTDGTAKVTGDAASLFVYEPEYFQVYSNQALTLKYNFGSNHKAKEFIMPITAASNQCDIDVTIDGTVHSAMVKGTIDADNCTITIAASDMANIKFGAKFTPVIKVDHCWSVGGAANEGSRRFSATSTKGEILSFDLDNWYTVDQEEERKAQTTTVDYINDVLSPNGDYKIKGVNVFPYISGHTVTVTVKFMWSDDQWVTIKEAELTMDSSETARDKDFWYQQSDGVTDGYITIHNSAFASKLSDKGATSGRRWSFWINTDWHA